jgi:hypothetical protein
MTLASTRSASRWTTANLSRVDWRFCCSSELSFMSWPADCCRAALPVTATFRICTPSHTSPPPRQQFSFYSCWTWILQLLNMISALSTLILAGRLPRIRPLAGTPYTVTASVKSASDNVNVPVFPHPTRHTPIPTLGIIINLADG